MYRDNALMGEIIIYLNFWNNKKVIPILKSAFALFLVSCGTRCHWYFIVNFYFVKFFLVSTRTWRSHDNTRILSMTLSQTPSHHPFAHLTGSIYLLRPGAACHFLFVYCDYNSRATAAFSSCWSRGAITTITRFRSRWGLTGITVATGVDVVH